MKKFYQAYPEIKRGRPKSDTVPETMTHALNQLEGNREECQVTFSKTFESYKGELPTKKTKSELKERYGQDIIVSVNKILTDAWYEKQRSKDEKEEQLPT